MRAVAEAHTLDDRWRDALGVHHRLEGGHILSQEVLVDAPKRPEIRAERRACSFAAVAVDFAPAVAIIITRPFVGAVAHGRMVGMQPRVIAGFVRKEEDTGGSDACFHNLATGHLVRMLDHPIAIGLGHAADHADDWWAVVLVGATPAPFVRAPSR